MRTICDDLEERLELLKKRRSKRRKLLYLALLLAAVWFVFTFVIGIAMVEGDSMRSSLVRGDIILYSRLPNPSLNYGDMILIPYSQGTAPGTLLVKRIAGLPGDEVDVDNLGHLTRNGESVNEPEALYGYQDTSEWMKFPAVVPENSYFYLGDNRAASLDSRHEQLGFIREDQVKGKILVIFRRPKT